MSPSSFSQLLALNLIPSIDLVRSSHCELQYSLQIINRASTIVFFFLVFFIICSYNDEKSLYSTISSSYQSISSSMGNVIFIFVRWSHHFLSIYTTQFLLNTTSYSTSSFPILHLLPIDSSMTNSFNNMVLTYQEQILNPIPNITFSDDVSFDYRISINSFLFYKGYFYLE